MAMNLKPARAKSKAKFSQNLLVIGLVVALIVTVMVTNAVAASQLNQTVGVAYLKESLPKDGIINSIDQFTIQPMQSMEYNLLKKNKQKLLGGSEARPIILEEDLKKMFRKGNEAYYASVYIPAGRPVYFEDLSTTGTQKNGYLYQMDGELIRLNITPDDFGDMVIPGDKLNIRITYETSDWSLPTEVEYAEMMTSGSKLDNEILVTEMLFSEVSILDMINGSGESIFDLYYELITLPQAQQQAIINSPEFKSRVAPSNILLSVTAEEADRYARIKNMGGQYTITLLPRDGTSEILDALDELKTGFARE